MSGIIPISSTRVSDSLVRERLLAQVQFDQRELFRLQAQVSTGKKFQLPSEDSPAALRSMSLQSLLERKAQVRANMRTSESFLAATDSALLNKRSVLQDFKNRVERAQVWSYKHPAEFGAALARIIGIPEEAARLQFERRATRWVPIDAQVVEDQQRTADFYLKVGLVKQKLDVGKTFDSQFSSQV